MFTLQKQPSGYIYIYITTCQSIYKSYKKNHNKSCSTSAPVSATSPNTSQFTDFGAPAQHKSQTENQQSQFRVEQQSTRLSANKDGVPV